MKYAVLILLALCGAAHAEVSNLNHISTLTDEGIATPPESLRLVTPTILDGVPLMQGLQLVQDEHAPPGTVTAIGIVDVDDVYNFYKIAMPHIGWQAAGPRDYMRDKEFLHINAQANGKTTTVTFTEPK